MTRASIEDRLAEMCFHRRGVVGLRMERSEERRGTRQVALSLSDARLDYKDIHVVGCDIKNLIKLSQRLGKTTLKPMGMRVHAEQVDIARVEPLGFVEIRIDPVPLPSPARNRGQRDRNT